MFQPEPPDSPFLDPRKFRNPERTADGRPRAGVAFNRLRTLWFNTGTLCNVTCDNCYIESSPRNDRLSYLTRADLRQFLDELEAPEWGAEEIGFTGGEPFMNPQIVDLLRDSLSHGYRVLVLTNAMRPLLKFKEGLLALKADYGANLVLRVSIDHYGEALHDVERGAGSWPRMMEGFLWLARSGFSLSVAGRTLWHESEAELRAGFAVLFAANNISLDAQNPEHLVLFPEMDAARDVAEISSACWSLLGVDAASMMCATSRMVVRRKGSARPAVVACTLLPYAREFELGDTLAAATKRPVSLNHPHCARFCVLGGGACSATTGES
ncbi:MAG: radical SAM protein [Alphaproteobacteria bacterium]